jgi:hypothetical protein
MQGRPATSGHTDQVRTLAPDDEAENAKRYYR